VMSFASGLANVSLKYNRWNIFWVCYFWDCLLLFLMDLIFPNWCPLREIWHYDVEYLQCRILSDGQNRCDPNNCVYWVSNLWETDFLSEGKLSMLVIF
jgi:hypothetical protein